MTRISSLALLSLILAPPLLATGDVVTFPSGGLSLQGVVFKPEGTGPFPAVVYNHGSAPGMLSKDAFEALGPVFATHGWVFFGPYRRGQGLSASAGPYIGDEIAAAEKKGGVSAGAATMVRLLETDHLEDQLAALAWLRAQRFVRPDQIAVAGNSFGGIETVLLAGIATSGVVLSTVLAMAKPKPAARYVVFRCFDKDQAGSEYYESLDLTQAAHPQTMLALELNDAPIDPDHGAPVRLRIPTQLGYKSAKWVRGIELASARPGTGGYWEDQGYEWYAGI